MYQSPTKNPYRRAYPIPWGIRNGNKSTYTHEPLFHLYPPQPSYWCDLDVFPSPELQWAFSPSQEHWLPWCVCALALKIPTTSCSLDRDPADVFLSFFLSVYFFLFVFVLFINFWCFSNWTKWALDQDTKIRNTVAQRGITWRKLPEGRCWAGSRERRKMWFGAEW